MNKTFGKYPTVTTNNQHMDRKTYFLPASENISPQNPTWEQPCRNCRPLVLKEPCPGSLLTLPGSPEPTSRCRDTVRLLDTTASISIHILTSLKSGEGPEPTPKRGP